MAKSLKVLTYDAVVIGAGVQGLSTAMFLARNGNKSVAVVEKEPSYGMGSSSRSGSMIMKSRETQEKIELSLFSFSFFERYRDVFREELLFRKTGFLSLVTEKMAPRYEAEHHLRRKLGVPSKKLTTSQIQDLSPAVATNDLKFGLLCEDDGEVSAAQILRCYYKVAIELGVDFYFHSEVQSFELAAGNLKGLKTTSNTYECEIIVNAAGAGAPKVASLLGIDVPQKNLRRSIFYCEIESPDLYKGPMVEDAELEWYYRGLQDGKVLIGMGLEPEGGATDGPNLSFLPTIRAATEKRVPALSDFKVINGHSGIRPLSPDLHPLIGPTKRHGNFFLNTGWGGEGIMHSPAGGAIVADLVDGTKNYKFETAEFSPSRFAI